MAQLQSEGTLRWRRRHPEKYREYNRAYQRALDPEKKRADALKWRRQNPDLVRAQTQRRLARMRADPERLARHRKKHREWLAKNPEKRATYSRKRHLRAEYGLTTVDYQAMVDKQGGRCAICQKPPRKLHVDHRHSDGKVRGLLCFHCNAALGQMGEDIGRLGAAIEYLRRWA